MKFVYWLAAGSILVSLAFFLPGRSVDLWPNVNSAGLAAAAFLTFLMVSVMRDPVPMPARISGWFIYVVCFVVIAAGWRTSYVTAHEQTGQMLQSGRMLGHGTLAGISRPVLLGTLESYYHDGMSPSSAARPTLKEIFLRRFPGAVQGTDIGAQLSAERPEGSAAAPAHLYVHSLEDTLIILTGISHLPGVNLSYPNYNGQTGRVQETVKLTPKGIAHVYDN